MHCILQCYDHITLASTSVRSQNYHLFFAVGTTTIQSLGNFEVYNAVLLTLITMLSVCVQNLCTGCKFIPLNNISPIPSPPRPWKPLFQLVIMNLTFQIPYISDTMQQFTSLTQPNTIEFCSCCHKWQDFLLCCDCILFCYIYTICLPYPFICQQKLKCFSILAVVNNSQVNLQ